MDSTQKSDPRSGVLLNLSSSTRGVEQEPNPPRRSPEVLADSPEVLALLKLRGRATLWRLVKHGNFPKPIKIGSRSLWLRREVLAWIEERAAERAAA